MKIHDIGCFKVGHLKMLNIVSREQIKIFKLLD